MPPSAKNEVLQIVHILHSHDIRHIYGLLNKQEFKMARYCQNSFFLCVYGPRRSQGV